MDSASLLGDFKVEDSMQVLNVATLGKRSYRDTLSYIPNIDIVIEHLDVMFPLTRPQETDSDRLLWMKAGQRQVVEYLQQRKIAQEEDLAVIGGH